MNVIEAMNYQYNNPLVDLGVHHSLVKEFAPRIATRVEGIQEQFLLWVSLSKENKKHNLVEVAKDQINQLTEQRSFTK